MKDHLDNPVGRLAAILRQAGRSDPNVNAADGWAKVLGAESHVELVAKIGPLLQLVESAKAAVEATPEGEFRDFHLQAFTNLNSFGAQFIALPTVMMGHFLRYTSEAVVSRLQSASLELRRLGRRSPVLDESQLQELLDVVRSLIDQVTANNSLSQDAKVYIVRRLQDVETALNGFKIGGFDSVAAAVAAVASGTLVVSDDTQRGWFKTLVSRLWGATAAHATDVKEIAESANTVMDAIDSARSLIS